MASAEEKYNEIIDFIETNIENCTEYLRDIDLVKAVEAKFCPQYAGNLREMNTLMRFLTEHLLREYIRERKLNAAYQIIISAGVDSAKKRIPTSVKYHYTIVAGYSDDAAFDKAFRNRYNMAPTDAIKRKDRSLLTPPLSWAEISKKEIDGREC